MGSFRWTYLLALIDVQVRCGGTSPSRNIRRADDSLEPLAFTFAPGGLLFPYYLGVAYQCQDLGLLRDSSPIGGASAGAIVATAIACGVQEREVRVGLAQLLAEVRDPIMPVPAGKLAVALRRQLRRILPEDAAERAQRHGLTIAYSEVYPRVGAHMVTSWESKEDLIDTVLASCNFPLYLSQWPLVKCRDSWTVDGFFAVHAWRFGCPRVEAHGRRTIAVVGVPHVPTAFAASDLIQPRRRPGMELPPGMGDLKWLWWALAPAPDESIDGMIEVGRQHAMAWYSEQVMGKVPETVPRTVKQQPRRAFTMPRIRPANLARVLPRVFNSATRPRTWIPWQAAKLDKVGRPPMQSGLLEFEQAPVLEAAFALLLCTVAGGGALLALMRRSHRSPSR